jgi:hypothetical protein
MHVVAKARHAFQIELERHLLKAQIARPPRSITIEHPEAFYENLSRAQDEAECKARVEAFEAVARTVALALKIDPSRPTDSDLERIQCVLRRAHIKYHPAKKVERVVEVDDEHELVETITYPAYAEIVQ